MEYAAGNQKANEAVPIFLVGMKEKKKNKYFYVYN